jgi:hypothetical protein
MLSSRGRRFCAEESQGSHLANRLVQVVLTKSKNAKRKTTTTTTTRRPIYNLCKAAKRASGTPTGTKFWWEQDLSQWAELRKDEDAADIVNLREHGV